MKRFLSRINLLLGSLSLLLAGCSSQKHTPKNHGIMVLYGVGLEDYAPLPETATPELSDDAQSNETNDEKSGTKSNTNSNEKRDVKGNEKSDAKKGVQSDSIPEGSRTIALPTDSLEQGLTPRGDRPHIMVKYGVMPPKQSSSN